MSSKNTDAYRALSIILAAIILLAVVISLKIPSTGFPIPDSPKPKERNRYAEAVLTYLSEPRFSNASLMKQLTSTDADMVMLDVSEKKAYFTAPHDEKWQSVVDRITTRPERAEYAKVDKGVLALGEWRIDKPGHFLFNIPIEDFLLDPTKSITVQFRNVVYTVSVTELADFLDNNVLYGGASFVRPDEKKNEVMANFGGLVAKSSEPSLKRLAQALVGQETDPSRIAQILLSFVTNEIEYDKAEERRTKRYDIQTVRRPVETLLTRKATCGSKVALYASLLEQAGIPYWIAYYPSHVSVFVKWSGPVRNGLSLKAGENVFALAETTTPGFVIGQSRLAPDIGPMLEPEYMQVPSERRMIDTKTGKIKSL